MENREGLGLSTTTDVDGSPPDRLDLRVVVLGVAGWFGALLALLAPAWLTATSLATAVTVLLLSVRRGLPSWVLAGCVLAATAVGAGSLVRLEANRAGPVARLAEERAMVTFTARVTSDPIRRDGRFGPVVIVRLDVTQIRGRGQDFPTSAPVVLFGEPAWGRVELGATVQSVGRLAPTDDLAQAARLSSDRTPEVLTPAGDVLGAAEAVRGGIRSAVEGASPEARALVPALVVGDDRQMSPSVVEDFRTCGLTHLAAVSGTNLTLVVGFLLVLARWVGVRARGLVVVGAIGVVGFVIVARAEPSVVRAAAMGTVALIGMGAHGRRQGVRGLGVATLVLLLVDPWLAISFGFVLSVLATAGILLLGPVFRDHLAGWMPRWAADAVAIPLAAQIMCTPVVAALSGEVSLVAVAANMVVAPAVAPATVLGLLGGLVMLVFPALGSLVGLAAGAFGWWIVAVAVQLARLPVAALEWSTGPISLALLTLLCVASVMLSGRVLRHRWRTALVCTALAVVMVRPLPTPGWPPDGWVMVACDVGQGDGIVLNAGHGRAIVVDVGPDPDLVDRCLDSLGVRRVLLVVLSHFHADHIGGLAGVGRGRSVDEVFVSGLADPEHGAATVEAWTRSSGVPVRTPAYGEVGQSGAVLWQVVGPVGGEPPQYSEGSAANNASLVLIAQVRGVRILASGDIEPEAQAELAASLPGLQVDVLKVPHHGSRYQDAEFLAGSGARVAVVSVGEGNEYGHPAPATVDVLEKAGMTVWRTDEQGHVAVVVDDEGTVRVRSR